MGVRYESDPPVATPEQVAEQEARDLIGRTNYCRMFGHDFAVRQIGLETVLTCSNHCRIDGAYRLERRNSEDRTD